MSDFQISRFSEFQVSGGAGVVKICLRPDVTTEIPAASGPGGGNSPSSGPQTGHLSGDPGAGHTVAPGALPVPHAATVMFVPMGRIFVVPQACSGGFPRGHGDRQVWGPTQTKRPTLYKISLIGGRRPKSDIPQIHLLFPQSRH